MFLTIKNISKIYANKIYALKGVSFDIKQGEIIGLLGVNGSGKTTLSSILATLISRTNGEVLYKNKSIYENINEFRRFIGFCPQKPNLNDELTIEENLFNDGLYFGFSKKKSQENLLKLTEKLSLNDCMRLKPDVLSGGYKQRVMIARAMMHDPLFIILDEPTVGLDPHIRRALWDIIISLKKEGITVLLTTHYLDEAEKLSDRVCILDKGNILLVDTPVNLKQKHAKDNLEDVFIELMKEEVS